MTIGKLRRERFNYLFAFVHDHNFVAEVQKRGGEVSAESAHTDYKNRFHIFISYTK